MRIIHTLRGKSKRGVSTILGTIIFIGILFTSVIPMLLVMHQADNIYEQKNLEIRRRDEEHDRENINVYAYPAGPGSSDLEIKIENDCELRVRLVRVWVNNTYTSRDDIIQSMKTEVIGPIPVPVQEEQNSSFVVHVTTERGNTFASGSGIIIYDGSDWVAETLGIFVQISSSGWFGFGSYRVTVTNVTNTNVWYDESQETNWGSGTLSYFFDVSEAGAGTYNVYVEKKVFWWGGGWQYKDDKNVDVEWPTGPAIVWIYFE